MVFSRVDIGPPMPEKSCIKDESMSDVERGLSDGEMMGVPSRSRRLLSRLHRWALGQHYDSA